jgi:hypothetical protein
MPFFGLEPFDTATVEYIWTGLGQPGFYEVTVKGNARKFSFGFKLTQDQLYIGILAVEVQGWTGPLASGTILYKVTGHFNGKFFPEIVVIGANKMELVPVTEVAFTTEEALAKRFGAT